MTAQPPELAAALGDRQRLGHLVLGVAAAAVALGVAVLFADSRIVIAAAAMVVALIVAFRYPFVAVLLYFVASAVRPEELGLAPVFLHVERIFGILCLAALVLPQAARRTWQRWQWETVDWSVAAFGAAACLSVPLSVSRPWALQGCYELAKLAFLYVAVRSTATTAPRLRAVVWTMLLVSAFSAIVSLVARTQGQVYIGEHGVIRILGPTSVTGSPDALGNALVDVLPFAVLLVGVERRLSTKVLCLGMAALFLYATALTGTRGAVVSLAVVLLIIVAQLRYRFLALGLAVAAVAVTWQVVPPDLKARYATLRTYQQEATYQGRVENLRIGLRMLRDHPLTGAGIHCFMIARVEEYDHRWSDAHNLLAQVAGETGILGLGAFTFFIAGTFLASRRARQFLGRLGAGDPAHVWLDRMCAATTLMLIALLVQGLGSHSMLRWQFYLGAALIVQAMRLARDAQPSPEAEEPAG
jgi:O-antigen ligase